MGKKNTYVFNLSEADRYEFLVQYEERQVHVSFGRAASRVGEITGELVCVAYPLDSTGRELIARLVIRDDEGVHRTIASSVVRRIILRCTACGEDLTVDHECSYSEQRKSA